MNNNLYVILALFVYAFIDYIGYNTIKTIIHRIIMVFIQCLISLALWKYCGLQYAIYFNILWWTWWADLIYYLYFDTLKLFNKVYAGQAFDNEVLGNKVVWAWWTPFGLIHTLFYGKNTPINWMVLAIQAIVGLIIVNL